MNLLTLTADGSNTLFNENIGENYHSKHGAVQESKHVFIDAGLKNILGKTKKIEIFEVGFGTGLNFLLTLEECLNNDCELYYTSLEPFPLTLEDIKLLNHHEFVSEETWVIFQKLYKINSPQNSYNNINLHISRATLEDFNPSSKFDLIYFDAFSVRHQPELWSDEIINKTCSFLKPLGIFVTYAITGKLKRAVKAANCTIEKLPGAPGKREMLRATKNL